MEMKGKNAGNGNIVIDVWSIGIESIERNRGFITIIGAVYQSQSRLGFPWRGAVMKDVTVHLHIAMSPPLLPKSIHLGL